MTNATPTDSRSPRRFLLRRSWDAVARRRGFSTTTDGVRLNEQAAARVAALAERFAVGA